jgi:hypothetical protein
MPGHSRSKNGVLSHAYDPGIHHAGQRVRSLQTMSPQIVIMDCRVKPGNDS